MGWQNVWVPEPTNMSLPVLAELPEDCRVPGVGMGGPKTMRSADYRRHFYSCHHCKGWIEGDPREHRINNLAPLSGRKGIEFYCIRCGNEIGFVGMMS